MENMLNCHGNKIEKKKKIKHQNSSKVLIWSSCKHDQVQARCGELSNLLDLLFILAVIALCSVGTQCAEASLMECHIEHDDREGRDRKEVIVSKVYRVFNETQEGIYGETHMDCTLLRRNHCPTARTRQQWGLFEFTVTKTNVPLTAK